MAIALSILYRGPLSSCNYGCEYCPFAKHHETAAELRHDRECLTRFLDWGEANASSPLRVFFTPWGEALTRRWYQDAMVRLSQLSHVSRVAVQTNLSCSLDWLEQADRDRIGLWCTYHPGETSRGAFVERCERLKAMGIRFSAGVVGLREHFEEIQALRSELPDDVYLWVNAYKRADHYYESIEEQLLTEIDPLFPFNAVRHESQGRPCQTGETVISVDGDGAIRRCHFVKQQIGNIYEPNWRDALLPRACPNTTCGCHIGYVHMPELGLAAVYGENTLERVPLDVEATKQERLAERSG